MTFPVYLNLGFAQVSAHAVFELAAYFLGFQFYRRLRARAGDAVGGHQRWWVIAGAILGALAGSKLVFLAADPALTAQYWTDSSYLAGGKTIVGGLAGGLLGVELTKKAVGITRSTGDLFALPLALGMMIGRIGCFLSGLADRTHGLPTTLPWGLDLGDGVPRHPVQLYEIGFLAVLAAWLAYRMRRPYAEGQLFKTFLVGYMAFRLAVDFLKPGVPLAGLTAIQWTCVAVLAYYGLSALAPLLSRKARQAHG